LGDFIGVLILLNADGVKWIVKLFCSEKKMFCTEKILSVECCIMLKGDLSVECYRARTIRSWEIRVLHHATLCVADNCEACCELKKKK